MTCQDRKAKPVNFTEYLDFVMDLCPKPAGDVPVCEGGLPDSKLEVELELKKKPQPAESYVCSDEVGSPDVATKEYVDECR